MYILHAYVHNYRSPFIPPNPAAQNPTAPKPPQYQKTPQYAYQTPKPKILTNAYPPHLGPPLPLSRKSLIFLILSTSNSLSLSALTCLFAILVFLGWTTARASSRISTRLLFRLGGCVNVDCVDVDCVDCVHWEGGRSRLSLSEMDESANGSEAALLRLLLRLVKEG
ncbi:hypothetical protein BZA05DRAFT_135915 [Tricharina praecox]|uniref:uncharacterized protein n=1 Tax=Tricharina praecox TaxID=43433 RepID=UPI00221F373B|nr:uncharacterized protein BZA05DRAFT_135915 [Tricharina praecox]KAI5846783.1 hypothetical protein BZA05DRAFT_135915 [Tricharina praecox]